MKSASLWQISLLTNREAEEATLEMLSSATGQAASSYEDLEAGTCRVSVYLPRQPADWPALRRNLVSGIERLRTCGLNPGPSKIALQELGRKNWAESWKRHFKSLRFAKALLIRPTWSHARAVSGQAVVILDPGLSFGTGQHPTTGFCVEQIVKARRNRAAFGEGTSRPQSRLEQKGTRTSPPLRHRTSVRGSSTNSSFLDVGTGSGILAICAAKLGYSPVLAFDNDPDAVRVAAQNAKRNRVLDRIQLRRGDVARMPLKPRVKYDLVCANLIANLLLEHRDRLIATVRPGGSLVLAGILATEFDLVRTAFEACGTELIAERTEKEWRSGAFRVC